MNEDTQQLEEIGSALLRAVGAPPNGLTDDELLARTVAVERVLRIAGGESVRLAGEVASRSRRELGDEGLSRSQNFVTPASMLSVVTGVSVKDARKRLEIGLRLRGSELLGGGVAPDPYPAVSSALAQGDLGVDTADVITRVCAALAERGVDRAAISAAEERLVEAAADPLHTADDIVRLSVRIREHLDPDGLEPRAEAQYEARALTLTRSADGMYRGRIALPPEEAGIWLGAAEALNNPRTAPRFTADPSGTAEGDEADEADARPDGAAQPGGVAPRRAENEVAVAGSAVQAIAADPRTGRQKLVDAVTDLIIRASNAPDMPRIAGSPTTVNVHITLDDLEKGRGAGWIDGIVEPVPVSTLERLRCNSPVSTTLLGDYGEVLRQGKSRRLFTPAQLRALAVRDGGCVSPGCNRPPTWCEAHHVVEWRSSAHPPGRTDIDNGVLLCRFHHSRVHTAGWRLVMLRGVPHIVPPRWIDADQVPVPVTRRRTTGVVARAS